MSKRWIWEFDGYPNFTYDRKELDSLIENIVFLQGSLSSTMSFVSKEILGSMIATQHNLAFYLWLVTEARKKITEGVFYEWKTEMVKKVTSRL